MIGFRVRHTEYFMVDPALVGSFGTDAEALADFGSQIISLIRLLLGAIAEVSANSKTIHSLKPAQTESADLLPVLETE